MMPITALVAALLAPLYLLLTLRVIGQRRSVKVAIGDGGDKGLTRLMRVHANFTETVPFALILMGLAESLNAQPRLLYIAAAALVIGRLAHAYGVSQSPETFMFRVTGMVLTFVSIAILALACAFGSIGRF
jgi:uncharacterized protein